MRLRIAWAFNHPILYIPYREHYYVSFSYHLKFENAPKTLLQVGTELKYLKFSIKPVSHKTKYFLQNKKVRRFRVRIQKFMYICIGKIMQIGNRSIVMA